MLLTLAKNYNPREIEAKVVRLWVEKGQRVCYVFPPWRSGRLYREVLADVFGRFSGFSSVGEEGSLAEGRERARAGYTLGVLAASLGGFCPRLGSFTYGRREVLPVDFFQSTGADIFRGICVLFPLGSAVDVEEWHIQKVRKTLQNLWSAYRFVAYQLHLLSFQGLSQKLELGYFPLLSKLISHYRLYFDEGDPHTAFWELEDCFLRQFLPLYRRVAREKGERLDFFAQASYIFLGLFEPFFPHFAEFLYYSLFAPVSSGFFPAPSFVEVRKFFGI